LKISRDNFNAGIIITLSDLPEAQNLLPVHRSNGRVFCETGGVWKGDER
jgi:hypothetical protein